MKRSTLLAVVAAVGILSLRGGTPVKTSAAAPVKAVPSKTAPAQAAPAVPAPAAVQTAPVPVPAAPAGNIIKPGTNAQVSDAVRVLTSSTMVPEPLSISAGEKRTINLPFRIESCRSNSSNVRIESISGSTFEISGVTPGRAIVLVVAGGLEKQFDITVFNSTLQTYQELGRLLEELPEVTLQLNDNGLVLRGVITMPRHWRYFRRITEPYKERCRDYVYFRPDARLIESLKKQFADAGFPVSEKSGIEYPGQVAFRVNDSVLTVCGHMLSDENVNDIKNLIAAQEWLNPDWNGGSFRAVTDLTVAPVQIDVGIVFVGVTRSQLERMGNSLADGTVLTWDVVAWFKMLYGGMPDAPKHGGGSRAGTSVQLQSNLRGSLQFFGENGVSDFRDAGHITLSNNDKEGGSFENGGSRQVMVYGSDSADLKEIDFGLKYKVKALLLGNDMVKLDLDLERSLAPIKEDKDYVQRKSKTKTSLVCPLGKTVVIAGQKEMTFSKSGPTGYAFLRHIPILNWFAAYDEDSGEQVQMLILVSPELMKQNVQLTKRPSDETAGLENSVSARVGKAEAEVLEKEELPWYKRIFVW